MKKIILLCLMFFHIAFIILIMNNTYSVIQKDKIFYIPIMYLLLNISLFFVCYIKIKLVKYLCELVIIVSLAYISLLNKNYSLLFFLNIFVTYCLYKLYFNLIQLNQYVFKVGNILLSIIILIINLFIFLNYHLIDIYYPKPFSSGLLEFNILTCIWCYTINIIGLFIMLIIYKFNSKRRALILLLYLLSISINVLNLSLDFIDYRISDKFTFSQDKICYYIDSDLNCRYNSYYLESKEGKSNYIFTNKDESISLVIYKNINNIELFNNLLTDLYFPTSVFEYKLIADNRVIELNFDFNIKRVIILSDNAFVIDYDNNTYAIDKEGNIQLLEDD